MTWGVEYCAGPSFPAKFPGRCGECLERIEEGDDIRMVEGRAIHDDCHDCTCGECE